MVQRLMTTFLVLSIFSHLIMALAALALIAYPVPGGGLTADENQSFAIWFFGWFSLLFGWAVYLFTLLLFS